MLTMVFRKGIPFISEPIRNRGVVEEGSAIAGALPTSAVASALSSNTARPAHITLIGATQFVLFRRSDRNDRSAAATPRLRRTVMWIHIAAPDLAAFALSIFYRAFPLPIIVQWSLDRELFRSSSMTIRKNTNSPTA